MVLVLVSLMSIAFLRHVDMSVYSGCPIRGGHKLKPCVTCFQFAGSDCKSLQGRCRHGAAGAVSVFFWFLGAHLLFFSEHLSCAYTQYPRWSNTEPFRPSLCACSASRFRNPDENIHQFYGSLLRSIWASSIFLNGEWVFCSSGIRCQKL